MEKERLHQLVADGVDRIKGRHGFLENHGNPIAADGPDCFSAKRGQFLTGEDHGAGAPDPVGRLEQTEDREGGDRFAGARFADQGMGLSCLDSQVDMLEHRFLLSFLSMGEKGQREVVDGQQRGHGVSV